MTAQASAAPVAHPAAADSRNAANPGTELNALLVNSSKGCLRSFERFYDLTHRLTFAVILRVNRDAAETEELCQELYLKVWMVAAQFDAERASALTWLTTMARNLALSSLRMRRARPLIAAPSGDQEDNFADAESCWPGPFEVVSQRQLKKATDAALADLPANQRQCLNLALLEEMTHQELATHMGRPLGTIKSWIRRSSARLQTPLRACL